MEGSSSGEEKRFLLEYISDIAAPSLRRISHGAPLAVGAPTDGSGRGGATGSAAAPLAMDRPSPYPVNPVAPAMAASSDDDPVRGAASSSSSPTPEVSRSRRELAAVSRDLLAEMNGSNVPGKTPDAQAPKQSSPQTDVTNLLHTLPSVDAVMEEYFSVAFEPASHPSPPVSLLQKWEAGSASVPSKLHQVMTTYFSLGQPLHSDNAPAAAAVAVVASSNDDDEETVKRPQRAFLYDPLVVQSANIDSVLERMSEDTRPKFFSLSRSARKPEPMFAGPTLPKQLDMPLHQRCKFCQQHDSMCHKCHHAWEAMQNDIRHQVAYGCYQAFPIRRRRQLLSLTCAYGVGAFVRLQQLLDPVLLWRYEASGIPGLSRSSAAGRFAYALHIAIFYGNLDVLKMLSAPLASDPRAKSAAPPAFPLLESGADPFALNPQLLRSPAARSVLKSSAAYKEFACVQLAKHLVAGGNVNRAELVVLRLLYDCPHSLVGLYSLVVVLLLRGETELATKTCRHVIALLKDRPHYAVPMTYLRDLEGVLCGDASTSAAGPPTGAAAAVVEAAKPSLPPYEGPCISLRHLPFSPVVRRILSFCDAKTLRAVHHCSLIPLLRQAAGTAAATLPSEFLTALLAESSGYAEARDAMQRYEPPASGAPLVEGQVTPLGEPRVVAMARDFKVFLVQCYLLGSVPSHTALADVPERVVTRQYRVNRKRSSDPWEVVATSDWEVDAAQTRRLAEYLRSRSPSAGQN